MTARVFLPVKVPRLDVTGAEKFGTLLYLFPEKHPSPLEINQVYEAICSALEVYRYEPGVDYIALTGPSIFLSLLTMAADNFGSKVKFLVFDAGASEYVEKELTAYEESVE